MGTKHESDAARYGIDRAIQLMRSLPSNKNVELAAMVIKTTLESLNVKVSEIIDDASARQRELEARIATLKGEVAALDEQLEARVDEIVQLEAQHAETTNVKERLELAERIRKPAS